MWGLLAWAVVILGFIIAATVLYPTPAEMCELMGGEWMEGSWCKRWEWVNEVSGGAVER